MQRKEEVDLLSGLLECCECLDGSAISLIPPNANVVFSKGFQLHFRGTSLDEGSKLCLAGIAKKNGVATKQEDKLLIVYKSLQPK